VASFDRIQGFTLSFQGKMGMGQPDGGGSIYRGRQQPAKGFENSSPDFAIERKPFILWGQPSEKWEGHAARVVGGTGVVQRRAKLGIQKRERKKIPRK